MSKETAKCNDQPASERSCPDPTGSVWWKRPSGWGYHWLNRGRGYPEMVCVQPGPTYDQDGRSVEVWDCPGERRSRLDAHKMPKEWEWQKIPAPNAKD